MTTPGAPPQLSPDGRWWWNGQSWVPAYASPPGTDGLAVASLVLGIVWLAGIGSVAAVVLGHLSRSNSRKEGRPPSGLALGGLVLGYLGLAGIALLITLVATSAVFVSHVFHGDAASVRSGLRQAAIVEETYAVDHGSYLGSTDELEAHGYVAPLGVDLTVVSAGETTYCLTAHAVGGGSQYYFTPSTGVTTTPCS